MPRRSRDFFGPRREGYYDATHRPLNCLLFLLPLIVLYEVGSLWVGSVPLGSTPPQRVTAFYWIVQFLGLFASVPTYLPGVLLVVIFGLWHLLDRDRVHPRWTVVGGMFLESLAMCLPLLVMNRLFHQFNMLAGGDGLGQELIVALTAGIYEELIFRLLLIWLLKIALIDLARLPRTWTMAGIVVLTAALFAIYHYAGAEPFAMRTFMFRTLAGIYLGGLFVLRGFGITVGVHAIYDVILTCLSPG